MILLELPGTWKELFAAINAKRYDPGIKASPAEAAKTHIWQRSDFTSLSILQRYLILGRGSADNRRNAI